MGKNEAKPPMSGRSGETLLLQSTNQVAFARGAGSLPAGKASPNPPWLLEHPHLAGRVA